MKSIFRKRLGHGTDWICLTIPLVCDLNFLIKELPAEKKKKKLVFLSFVILIKAISQRCETTEGKGIKSSDSQLAQILLLQEMFSIYKCLETYLTVPTRVPWRHWCLVTRGRYVAKFLTMHKTVPYVKELSGPNFKNAC